MVHAKVQPVIQDAEQANRTVKNKEVQVSENDNTSNETLDHSILDTVYIDISRLI